MPRYDYRCRACGDTFEVSRPMSESNDPARCPTGHDDTIRVLSSVAVGGLAGGGGAAESSGGGGGCGGGCCGGACGR